ncbi:glycosyltransferase family 2 protein [Candidatus Gottesmanbacteria bacterium]|nr:glycosyltransferase family 2 protein [Candidatus Gottesmanbacteria bacterium]
MKNKISAVILLSDEDIATIERCLNSIIWCDEIILLLDNSKDVSSKTESEIKEKIINSSSNNYQHISLLRKPLNADFSAQRNFGLEKTGNTWVLFIDADEAVTDKLKKEIQTKLDSDVSVKTNGYLIKRDDYIFGKKLRYGETGKISFLRMGRKAEGGWEGKVHETWMIKGKIEELENSLDHYPHQQVASFLQSINFYTEILSKEWYKEGKSVSVWEIIAYPKLKFLSNYIFKLGFLDGTAGLVMAIMMSMHSFLVRSKLWLMLHQHDNT